MQQYLYKTVPKDLGFVPLVNPNLAKVWLGKPVRVDLLLQTHSQHYLLQSCHYCEEIFGDSEQGVLGCFVL